MLELEREVLAEYERLASNLEQLTDLTTALSQVQPEMLERLRPLEGRLGLVLTLFKAAVWSYVKNEEARAEEERASDSSTSG